MTGTLSCPLLHRRDAGVYLGLCAALLLLPLALLVPHSHSHGPTGQTAQRRHNLQPAKDTFHGQGSKHALDNRPSPARSRPDAADVVTGHPARVLLHKQGSSVTCAGSSVNTRICQFSNICYDGRYSDWIFLHGPHTTIDGVPSDIHDPALLTLSSVQSHNYHYLAYTQVNASLYLQDLDIDTHGITLVTSRSLIFRRFKPDNVMHFVHDDLLPVFSTLVKRFGPDWMNTQLVIADEFAVDLELMQLFGKLLTTQPLLFTQSYKSKGIVCFSDATAGLDKSSTWYDYGFNSPQHPLNHTDPRLLALFASHVKGILKIDAAAEKARNAVAEQHHQKSAVVFTRKRNRFLLNEADIVDMLRQRFDCAAVHIVGMEDTSFAEQVQILSQADVALGVHGSILIMGMFLPQHGVLVEIFPYGVPSENYTPYRTMCSLRGIRYVGWENPIEANSVTHPDRRPEHGGIRHLSADEQQKILTARWVPLHKCCTNPYWLYRIYSDTLVDVALLETTIREAISQPVPSRPGEILPEQLPPAKVSGVTCSFSQTQADSEVTLRVEWDAVWNSKHLRGLEYEVWVQQTMQVYKTRDIYMVIRMPALDLISVWVRGITLKPGPFGGGAPCQVEQAQD